MAGRFFILAHSGVARMTLQVGDPGQIRQNLILHAVCEVHVFCLSSLKFSNGRTAIDFIEVSTAACCVGPAV